jgi:hypothetical protein
MMLQNGITYPKLLKVLRPMFIEVAIEEIKLTGVDPNLSRISVNTGIARKFISELKQLDSHAQFEASPSVASKVIAEWTTSNRYLDENGNPLILSRYPVRNGQEVSFDGLVTECNKDIRSRALLDDLLNKELVELVGDDKVRLLNSAYKPDSGSSEMMDVIGDHLHDHISAISQNVKNHDRVFFDRSAYHDSLTDESIEKLNDYVDEVAMDTLRKVYKYAQELESKQAETTPSATNRMRLGIYHYHEKE